MEISMKMQNGARNKNYDATARDVISKNISSRPPYFIQPITREFDIFAVTSFYFA